MSNNSNTVNAEMSSHTEFWYYQLLWDSMETALKRVLNKKSPVVIIELYKSIYNLQSSLFATNKVEFTFSSGQSSRDKALVETEEFLPLSIVVTTRNDTHVERMEDRTQIFIDSILYLAEKYKTKLELIIVEWNAPKDRLAMVRAFNYPATHQYVSIRIIDVTPPIHSRYEWSDSLPLYQMIAKNVGIRRARGEFVLATNIDILFSEELFTEITSKRMNKANLYRSNRWDIDRIVLDILTAEQQLKESRHLCFQINYRDGLFPVEELQTNNKHNDTGSSFLPSLHTMACGDFQMLHRDDWLKVRGYSELDAYSYHLDSLFALTCYHAGLNEVLLSNAMPHYHIDHTLGVKVNSDKYEINENKVISHISMFALTAMHIRQDIEENFILTNQSNWGLAGDILTDELVSVASWDTGVTYTENTYFTNTLSSLLELSSINNNVTANEKRTIIETIFKNIINYISLHAQSKPLYIWGTGEKGEMLHSSFQLEGLEVEGFIHGGPTKSKLNHQNVISADEFVKTNLNERFVIIASMFNKEIIDLLELNGAKEGIDFINMF